MSATRAVVVGAGIGGLAAAAALARHVDDVVLLERDRLPEAPVARPGVPQGRHVHGLLGGGFDAFAQLLPGLAEALDDAGAVRFRVGLESRLELPGQAPFPLRDAGWDNFSMSRPLFEHVVRGLVRRHVRVRLRTGCRVHALACGADGAAVSEVRFTDADGQPQRLAADLIVDASGRGALTLELLQAMGLPAPEEASIPVDIRYTCAVYALSDRPRDWKVLMTRPDLSGNARRAIMFPLEGGREWILGLGGVAGDSAPTDAEGFVAYARSLRTTTAHDAIRDATLRGEIVRFAFPQSQRRHFERLARFPRGLLPVADAICRINPSFGQGMSVAAQQAVLLDRLLGKGPADGARLAGVAPPFFAALGGVLDTPWAAAAQDYGYAHLAPLRPPGFANQSRFLAALQRLAAADAEIHRLMLEVSHLKRPASAYAEPGLAARIEREMQAR